MDAAARVTSKGQVTIPKAVCEALGIRAGDAIVFRGRGQPGGPGQDRRCSVAGRLGAGAGSQAQRGLGRCDPHDALSAAIPSPVSAFVDTNIFVRHLTGDPPDMAAPATAYLRSAPELLLTDLVVAETVNVLESF